MTRAHDDLDVFPATGPVPVRHRRAPGGRRRSRALAVTLLVVVLALAVVVGWLALDAVRARDALTAARGDVQALREHVVAGEVDAAAATLPQLQERARTAYESTHGPLWGLAAAVPWVGDDVEAVRTVSAVIDDLASEALPALMQATALVDPAALAPVDGRLDLAPISAVAPQVVAADAAVQVARDELAAIDTDGLVGLVADPVVELRTQVDDVAATTATAARAATLLPSMLGADGPREYLLLVQNNAEPRATGGIPGIVVHLRADGGAVQVVEQLDGWALGGFGTPVLPLTESEDALFGPLLGADMRDVTFTPDFTRSAALAREMWLRRVGGTVDGVLSLDPGALAHVLRATGPVTLEDGAVLTADDVVQTLLSTVYLELEDPADQDEFFAQAAAAVFAAVVSGQGDAGAVVDALAQGAREGRVMVWSAHEDEQARLAGTVLSGELRGAAGTSGVIGVYLNDATEAKMGYYLDLQVTGTATECLADGGQLVHVTVTLTSDAPADAADLPWYLTGGGAVVPAGDVRTNVLLYAPLGGAIEQSWVNSTEGGLFSQVHDGLSVGAVTFDLAPGQSSVVELDVRSGPDLSGTTTIRTTPTAHGTGPITIASAC